MIGLYWQFLIYSFLGFLLEVVFARLTRSAKPDRKCMYLLPLCPVYGLGAVLITHLPVSVLNDPLLLFLCGALTATAVEYFMDWFYETTLGVRFWNYSSMPGNLNGRVCLIFSFAWGILSLALVGLFHPLILPFADAIPDALFLPSALLTGMDCALTVILLRSTGETSSLRWYDRFLPSSEEKY